MLWSGSKAISGPNGWLNGTEFRTVVIPMVTVTENGYRLKSEKEKCLEKSRETRLTPLSSNGFNGFPQRGHENVDKLLQTRGAPLTSVSGCLNTGCYIGTQDLHGSLSPHPSTTLRGQWHRAVQCLRHKKDLPPSEEPTGAGVVFQKPVKG